MKNKKQRIDINIPPSVGMNPDMPKRKMQKFINKKARQCMSVIHCGCAVCYIDYYMEHSNIKP